MTHGETYLDADAAMDENTMPTLWWSHGGTLKGTSPARIMFLKKLVEETVRSGENSAKRTGLDAGTAPCYLNASSVAEGRHVQEILYYMDFHQPIYYEFPLPEGSFSAELIDPWEMKILALSGQFSGKSKIRLSGWPFQVVRFRRI